MPIDDEQLAAMGATQQPGAVPGTTQVTLPSGEVIQVADQAFGPSGLTAEDVGGQLSPAEEAAAALGYTPGSLEGMGDALMASDEEMAQQLEAAQQAGMSAPIAQATIPGARPAQSTILGGLDRVRTELFGGPSIAAPVGAIAEMGGRRAGRALLPEGQSDVREGGPPTGLRALQEQLENDPSLAEYAPSSESPVITSPGGMSYLAGERVTPATPRRGGPSVVTQIARDFIIPGGDPELERIRREEEDKDVRLMQEIANNNARLSADSAEIMRGAAQQLLNNRQELEQITAERMETQREGLAALEQLNQQVMNQRINPERFFTSRGSSARFSAAASVALGTLSQALTPGLQNAALSIIDNAIERDIGAQVENLRNAQQGVTRQRGILQDLRLMYNDELAARTALRAMYLTEAERRIEALRASTTSENQRVGAQRLAQDLRMRRAQAAADLAERIGSVRVIERVTMRGHANSAAASRRIGRMMGQASAPGINAVRAREGLAPIEATPAPARGRGRGGRRRRTDSRVGTSTVMTTSRLRDSAESQEPTTIRTRGGNVLAIPSEEPVMQNGRYVFRNPQTGQTRTVASAVSDGPALLSQGFRQVIETGFRRAEEADSEAIAAAQFNRGGFRLPNGRTVPPERRGQYEQLTSDQRTKALQQLGAITRARGMLLRVLNQVADGNVIDRSAINQLESMFSLFSADLFGDQMGAVGDNERALLDSLQIGENWTGASSQLAQNFLYMLGSMESTNDLHRISVPTAQVRSRGAPVPGSLRGDR